MDVVVWKPVDGFVDAALFVVVVGRLGLDQNESDHPHHELYSLRADVWIHVGTLVSLLVCDFLILLLLDVSSVYVCIAWHSHRAVPLRLPRSRFDYLH